MLITCPAWRIAVLFRVIARLKELHGATMNMPGFDRITVDPNIMAGKPSVRGMRITVALVLNLLAGGMKPEEIIRDYPYLELEDIHQVLRYAAWLTDEKVVPLEHAA